MESLGLLLWLILYAISIYTDLKWHKIKNFITLPSIVTAIGLITWKAGLRACFFYIAIVFFAGLLTEFFKIWGSGDTKLFIAAALLSAVWVGTTNAYFVMYFLDFNILLYLGVGHAYTFYKSGFKPSIYIASLHMGGEIGKIPGALPIAISNMAAIVLFWAWR